MSADALNTAPAPLPSALSSASPSGTVRLHDWGVIRAQGADAAKFLHGQLTQDVEHLAEGEVRLAGYCSAKGRLLASFVMWRRGPEEVLLACSADLLAPTLKRLSMFVLRARCKLSDASAELPLWGLAGAAAGEAAPWTRQPADSGEQLQLPPALANGQTVPRALWVGAALPAPLADAPALAPETWRWLEVHSGVARIVAATTEQFVPQMVNLELVGGVNFKKGCYPGQEVVARSQYRGTLKRRAYAMAVAAEAQPGQEVFAATEPEQPAGLVALAGAWAGQQAALVEMKMAAVDAGMPLHLGAVGGPLLTPSPLPYELARDDA